MGEICTQSDFDYGMIFFVADYLSGLSISEIADFLSSEWQIFEQKISVIVRGHKRMARLVRTDKKATSL